MTSGTGADWDESQHPRGDGGQFAPKPPAPEDASVELEPQAEKVEPHVQVANEIIAELRERKIRDNSIGINWDDGTVTVYGPTHRSNLSTFLSIRQQEDGKFTLTQGWEEYERETGAWDGDESDIKTDLTRDEAIQAMDDEIEERNAASEYGEAYDVREPPPLPEGWAATFKDPWAQAVIYEPPF